MAKHMIACSVDLFTKAEDRRTGAAVLREEALRTRADLRPRGTLPMPAEALVHDEAIQVLTDALADQDDNVRTAIAAVLGDIGGEGCVAALARTLDDEQPTVAMAAAASLGQIGGREAAEALVRVATAPHDSDLKLAALTALELLTAKHFTSGPDRRLPPESRKDGPASMSIAATGVKEPWQQASLVAGMEALENNAAADPFLRLKAGDILSFLNR